MPAIEWNVRKWDTEYNWGGEGEEWSAAWGSSRAQWLATLYPRLFSFLPAKRILEIAPGFGRWTSYLLPFCDEFKGIDLSAECVAACRERFAHVDKAEFLKNDGLSLGQLSGHFDLVFSFDSLVHADTEVFEQYIPQVIAKLNPGGVAFIHHSNFAASHAQHNHHNRSENVTAASIEKAIGQSGGHLICQEILNWGDKALIDAISVFAKGTLPDGFSPERIENPNFMQEANLCRSVYDRYMLAGDRYSDERQA